MPHIHLPNNSVFFLFVQFDEINPLGTEFLAVYSAENAFQSALLVLKLNQSCTASQWLLI